MNAAMDLLMALLATGQFDDVTTQHVSRIEGGDTSTSSTTSTPCLSGTDVLYKFETIQQVCI